MRSSNNAQTILIIQSNKTREGEFDQLKGQINQIMLELLGRKARSANMFG